MSWKQWPYWLKGGIAMTFIGLVLRTVQIIFSSGKIELSLYTFFQIVALYSMTAILYFIVGAVIGGIIDFIISRKHNPEKSNLSLLTTKKRMVALFHASIFFIAYGITFYICIKDNNDAGGIVLGFAFPFFLVLYGIVFFTEKHKNTAIQVAYGIQYGVILLFIYLGKTMLFPRKDTWDGGGFDILGAVFFVMIGFLLLSITLLIGLFQKKPSKETLI